VKGQGKTEEHLRVHDEIEKKKKKLATDPRNYRHRNPPEPSNEREEGVSKRRGESQESKRKLRL